MDRVLLAVAVLAGAVAAWSWFGPAATVGVEPVVLSGAGERDADDLPRTGTAPSPTVPDAAGEVLEPIDALVDPLIDASAANPARVRVPSIGVDAVTISLGKTPENKLEVPADTSEAGWWRGGPEPGEQGPGVITGHVDSRAGPGVFFRLDEVVVGDLVHVDREDGTTASFRVTGVEQHAKTAFPTERVYGPTDGSTLRLVTCGGGFDRSSRHYLDNVIVFAERVPPTA